VCRTVISEEPGEYYPFLDQQPLPAVWILEHTVYF
jgi:hypothetical protein